MFKTGVVRASEHDAKIGGKVEIYFRFFIMKVYSLISLESPYRGDSNENKNIPFSIIKENNT